MHNVENILVAKIVATKGLKGYVKLNCFFNDIDIILSNSLVSITNNNTYNIVDCYIHGNLLIAKFKDINTIEQAQSLIGLELYLPRSSLPELNDEDTYYASDLIDCNIYDNKDILLGVVYEVQNFGAGDILQVKLLDNTEKMLSFNVNSIIDVNLANKKIIINSAYLI